MFTSNLTFLNPILMADGKMIIRYIYTLHMIDAGLKTAKESKVLNNNYFNVSAKSI